MLRVVLALSFIAVLASACGDDCETVGDTRCSGSTVEVCLTDGWSTVDDCSDNVDTGTTECGSFDGDAACVSP